VTTESLAQFIGSARWFGGKGRGFTIGDVRHLGWLASSAAGGPPPGAANSSAVGTAPVTEPVETPRVRIELVTVEYDDGASEVYQVPLAYYTAVQGRLEHALVGEWTDGQLGQVFVYDALHDHLATSQWLQAFDRSKTEGELAFHRLEGYDLDLDNHGALFSGEQSNSSVAFGEDSLMKVFRKVTPGRNPDIEIHIALTRAENEHVAALYGWLEAPARTSEEPLHLAMLSQFLRTASDGWGLALASVRDLFAEADLHADEVGGDFAAESQRLGVATAEVHDALAAQFPTQRWDATDLAALAAAMRERLAAAIEIVPALAEHAEGLREAFDALTGIGRPVVVQRVHGDFHLGQTLRTVKGWKIVDFEGEPAKPLVDRTLPDSGWRDVAGMMRSFDYAAHAVEADLEEGAQIAYRALEWAERNRSAFLAGYIEASDRIEGDHLSADQETLLKAYEVDKAVYETIYEARNRPDWLPIPLAAIGRLVRPADHDDQEASP
jgi:maltokinase